MRNFYWKWSKTVFSKVHGVKFYRTISCPSDLLHKKLSFPLRVLLVNVTKSAVFFGYGHIYRRNFYWKIPFFVQWLMGGVQRFSSMLFSDIDFFEARRSFMFSPETYLEPSQPIMMALSEIVTWYYNCPLHQFF